MPATLGHTPPHDVGPTTGSYPAGDALAMPRPDRSGRSWRRRKATEVPRMPVAMPARLEQAMSLHPHSLDVAPMV